MNLIYYRGLNCHLACIINIADTLGVNYRDAFGTLWSETDFIDNPEYHIYLSQRVLPNLEALGIKLEILRCASPEEAEESLSLIPEGELFLIGMDTFHTPWSPAYQGFREHHYFFAQKGKKGALLCFDPLYNQKNTWLTSGDIVSHAFDLSRVHKLAVNPPHPDVAQEAREILVTHPEIQEKLSIEIQKSKDNKRKNLTPLIKQITAMINNRYLFQHFLNQYPFAQDQQFFDRDFLSKWEAVKNGLYKASVIRNNQSVTDEVYSLFMDLMCQETDMAKEMIIMESDSG